MFKLILYSFNVCSQNIFWIYNIIYDIYRNTVCFSLRIFFQLSKKLFAEAGFDSFFQKFNSQVCSTKQKTKPWRKSCITDVLQELKHDEDGLSITGTSSFRSISVCFTYVSDWNIITLEENRRLLTNISHTFSASEKAMLKEMLPIFFSTFSCQVKNQ